MKSFLVDGPIMLAPERRKETIERMAKDLAETGAIDSDQDSIRLLMHAGYPSLDVALLAGEARMVAMQEIVAREISEP
jgi:hypothetical protein